MAKPKLALIPAAQGTKFYSVLPSDGVGDFTFARGSEATRINAQGLIENVASGVSRLNYPMIDGVQKGCPHHILEPARTNGFPYSESFSNSDWTKSNATITGNSIISPDGTLNASKLTENTVNSNHRISDTIVVSGTGVAYTQSIFAKSGGNGRFLRISRGSGTYNFAVFDLENGVVVSQGGSRIISTKIEKYPNGWYRCISTFTTQFSNIATYYGLQNGNLDSYTGDGTSSLYIFGAMLEAGSFPTSYIPTNGESGGVTRSAETANGAGNASTFNDSEGVLMAEISALANDLTNRYILLGTTSNNVYIRYQDSSNSLRCNVTVNGSSQFIAIFTLDDETINSKISVKYKENDFNLYVNGFKLKTDLGGSTFTDGTLTELAFDNGVGGNFPFYGNVKQIQYFDSALADTQLEQLTSWTSFTDMANGQLYTIE